MTGRGRGRLISAGPDLALVGVGAAVLLAVITGLAYTGTDGEAYSPLNHTVSELGERGVSELALAFNVALIVGGACIAVYMLSIVWRATTRAERGLGLLGFAAGVAMASVGLFPVDDLAPHIAAAAMAFLLVLLASAWFALWALRGAAPYPRWLGWFAAWIALVMILFFSLPGLLQPEYSFETEFSAATPRPDVLLNSVLEWLAIGSAWVWIAGLAIYDRARLRRSSP
jgi:hypothetical protein